MRLADFEPLDPVQTRLKEEIGTGEPIPFGPRPNPDDPHAPTVDAAFLRYLILGGCDALPHPIPASGVQLAGLRITGTLNLETETIPRDIALIDCHFDEAPNLLSARIASLFLNGSHLPGLEADRLSATGGVFLRGAEVTGEIRLLGADLGGHLDGSGATLTAGATGTALNADRLSSRGGVFLRDATVRGEIRLPGADLGGDLSCSGATLTAGATGRALSADLLRSAGQVSFENAGVDGDIHLQGVRIAGDLGLAARDVSDRTTFRMQNARIDGVLSLRQDGSRPGLLDLAGAHSHILCDRLEAWPQGHCILDRFTYDAIVGAPTDAETRIDWLMRQHPVDLGEDFKPQPWEHCARVLRETGHADDARAVLIRKDHLQRRARRARLRARHLPEDAAPRAVTDRVLHWTVAYRRRPLQAAWWLAAAAVLGAFIFGLAEAGEAMKPNDPVVLTSPAWTDCAGPGQMTCFYAEAGTAYPRFDPIVYSLDTLIPLVSLEMQTAWLPDDTRPGIGSLAGIYLWIHIGLGWALSLLAVAGLSGLIKLDNT